MELVLFCLLVAWFMVSRAAVDTATIARRGLAWGADRLAGGADRAAHRSPRLAGLVGRWARAIAARLRNRPKPSEARTSDGQALRAAAGQLAVAGVALLLVWVRLVVVDAIGAANAALVRRSEWTRWPVEGEPGGPVRATAQRTDRPVPPAGPALPPGRPAANVPPTVFFTFIRKDES
ncbi:hypothetical protein JOF41_007342 [Saccharothrix coeruleofusca]|uniref:hypothetical protein n=1 Tax=Saccharothrix coeruleofusca TaxID=33919 RepID=UPI001AE16EF9|nr:hypothetical protein [Saccharothrix coeruleofusca]MBP2341088.1 hypothetical protein [Saccharothrix coeruleofusca]